MERIAAEHRRRNEETRDAWSLFAPHRDRVTQLLTALAEGEAPRLCVLGAGNCNDLDLAALMDRFATVQLVDLDAAALAAGVEAQQVAENGRIERRGGVDVSGVCELLESCSPAAPTDETFVERLLQQASACAPLELSAPADVAASVCLLTQMVDSVVMTLGQHHPRFLEVLQAVRARHLRLLLELVRPGGSGVLVTDIVSSETFPALPNVSQDQLTETVGRLIQARNFFTGANPFVLRSLLQSDPQIAPLVASVELSPPWLWNLGPRVYAVCSLVARRRGGGGV